VGAKGLGYENQRFRLQKPVLVIGTKVLVDSFNITDFWRGNYGFLEWQLRNLLERTLRIFGAEIAEFSGAAIAEFWGGHYGFLVRQLPNLVERQLRKRTLRLFGAAITESTGAAIAEFCSRYSRCFALRNFGADTADVLTLRIFKADTADF